MKGSVIIVGAFLVGSLAGNAQLVPQWLAGGDITMWILYLLMLQVGMSVGCDPRLKQILRTLSPRLLLLPCATILGTLMATAMVSMLLPRWSLSEVLAVGSGMGYYSLSSILISSLKEPLIGATAAAELGTIALMANLLREMMTLLFAPIMVRYFSPFAPICSGGATTMDVTLPVITRYSGREWVFVAIMHGMVVDFSVPLLVPLFCSL